MRLLVVLAATCLLSACAAGGSSGERAFIEGSDSARAAQADLDARAIVQGMEQARSSDQRVARILVPVDHSPAPAPVMR